MRFLYAIIAMMLWMIFVAKFGLVADNNTLLLSFAIVGAGAMAGGD